jgi:argonaute-like protein implicated in RNA metabolism and viral defense
MNLGVDVVRCQDVADLGASDESHLIRANEQGRVLLTRDLDFVIMSNEWLQQGLEHTGIIYINADRRDNTRYIVSRIMNWQQNYSAEQKNTVWWV